MRKIKKSKYEYENNSWKVYVADTDIVIKNGKFTYNIAKGGIFVAEKILNTKGITGEYHQATYEEYLKLYLDIRL